MWHSYIDCVCYDICTDCMHYDILWLKQLVDLPCIIESLKATDRKNFFKTADICQVSQFISLQWSVVRFTDFSQLQLNLSNTVMSHFTTWLLMPQFCDSCYIRDPLCVPTSCSWITGSNAWVNSAVYCRPLSWDHTSTRPVSENIGRRCIHSAAHRDLAVLATRKANYSPYSFASITVRWLTDTDIFLSPTEDFSGSAYTLSARLWLTLLLEQPNITT